MLIRARKLATKIMLSGYFGYNFITCLCIILLLCAGVIIPDVISGVEMGGCPDTQEVGHRAVAEKGSEGPGP